MRNVLRVGTLALSIIMMPSHLTAQIDTESLTHITNAVRDMCLHPDRRGNFLQVEGEADAGILVKIVGANLSGTIKHESWEGINQRFDQYKTDPRECTVQVLPVIIANFTPRTQDTLTTEDIQGLLENIIHEFEISHVERSRFTNHLALEIARQRSFMFPVLQAAGDFEDLRLLNSQENESGKRIYSFVAYHESANFVWTISTNSNGIVDVLYVQPI